MLEQTILSRIARGDRIIDLYGCEGSYLALLLARLVRTGQLPRPLVAVMPREEQTQLLARDLSFFLGAPPDQGGAMLQPVMYFAPLETSPYSEISFDRLAMMQRLTVLFRLTQGLEGAVLVLSASSLRRRVFPRQRLVELCDIIIAEEELDRDEAVRRLVDCGFHPAQIVEDPGTFAVRGGILDFFPPLHRFPVRLEFFGDLVESIRLFDPTSQRTLRAITEVYIHPIRETILLREMDRRARILEAADAVNHPSSKTRALLEEIESGREFFGIEALSPVFHEQLESLCAYLPPNGLWFVQDPEGLEHELNQEDEKGAAAYAARQAEGRLTFPPADFFVDRGELIAQLDRRPLLQGRIIERFVVDDGEEHTTDDHDRAATSTGHCPLVDSLDPALRSTVKTNADLIAELQRARRDHGEEILKVLARRLRQWLSEYRPVLVAVTGTGQQERLAALLKGYGITCGIDPSAQAALTTGSDAATAPEHPATIQLRSGELSEGFRVPGGLVVLTEEEIFGPKVRRQVEKRLTGPGVGDLRELGEGDYIVHAEHGIGRYQGLVKLNIRGVPADFLLLEYQGGDRLYLPVYRMNLVQKFSAGDGVEPKLDRMGGLTWAKKKSKVRLDVRKLAEELLQLYAQRAALQGHAFPTPDALYSEFEATFPFTETPDQLQAVQDVITDLCAPRPMDRLICGDVGFGKTEVALRAVFLAAMANKQVAVLAPTTVLVEQHVHTFTERLAAYPLRVESLSRFRQRSEARQVLADLAQGRVDVIIGTHRLLSSDVRFKDLGLLIIDEEQRFGVAHKERIKRLRTQVDVLTLTATPIPRTLQMGMIGMREITVISTAPVDRLAIRTLITRYSDALVAEGMRKELDRGGQIFFVHNRVESIEKWASRLQALVPEARVAVAHGQMEAGRLEKIMVDFVAGTYDILVCTTIIESGLDIPRANTMFINRGDCFGLAQLYQLRGRIGRSKHRAFCYLLIPGYESMTSEARSRLATLQRFSELGSGFAVASHDLEIRGAGDLLGAKQSGHIAALGFDAYARILQEAVAELRGEPIIQESDPELNTAVPAFIPDDYVEDTGQRLDLYKRLSSAAQDADSIQDIIEEMRDRYGENPPEVIALGELMMIKGLATALGALVLDLTQTRLALRLSERTPLSPERVIELVSHRARSWRLTPEMQLIRTLDEQEQQHPLLAAKKILHELIAHVNQPL